MGICCVILSLGSLLGIDKVFLEVFYFFLNPAFVHFCNACLFLYNFSNVGFWKSTQIYAKHIQNSSPTDLEDRRSRSIQFYPLRGINIQSLLLVKKLNWNNNTKSFSQMNTLSERILEMMTMTGWRRNRLPQVGHFHHSHGVCWRSWD